MELLQEYSSLIANIKYLSDEIPELRDQLMGYESMLSKYKRDRANLDAERTRKQTELMNAELNRLTAEEYSKINSKQAELDSKLQVLTLEHNNNVATISSCIYETRLRSKYDILAKLQNAERQYHIPADIPPEMQTITANYLAASQKKYTNQTLLNLIDNIQSAYKNVDVKQLKKQQSSRIVDFLTLKAINKSSLQNHTKLLVYFAYLIGLIVLCVTVPVIPILGIGVTSVIAYSQYARNNKYLIQFILPYSSLEDGLSYIRNDIDTKVNEFRKTDLVTENKRFKEATVNLVASKNNLEAEYARAAEQVRMSISSDELQRRVEAQFQDTIQKCESDITNTERAIHRTNKFIQNNQTKIPQLKEKQKVLLAQIKEAYLNPSQPGTSRRLIKSFFLGIDEKQGNLIEFKYDGNTTLIMYKGETCRTNKDLISMMLMQLLSSMSLTTLSIYLTDLKSAGSDYAVFFQPELSGKLHMCATDAEVKKAISILHTELIMRTRDILTEAESLEQYNEEMLARKSLPREYIFFILQDPTDKDMEKQELQQLLNNGPTVGIIPIIFLRHTDIVNGFNASGNTITSIIPFFKAFGQYSFTFDGMTSDLTATPDLSATIIAMLQKGKSK